MQRRKILLAMKKPSIKIPKRQKKSAPTGRIVSETVAEHREHILAGGRRFKYPLQYSRHKLVFNTVVVSITAVIILLLIGWWQLYVVQNTSTFFYRVTQILPVPVATVDATSVRYSDYLLYYRPSEYYLNKYDEIRRDSEDGRLQLEYKKRDAMDRAITVAIAEKIAKERKIEVSNQEIDEQLNALKQADNGTLSDGAINSSAQRVFGMSEQDTRDQYRNSLLKGKAAFAVDDKATALKDKIDAKLQQKNPSLKQIASDINKTDNKAVQYQTSGKISKSAVFNGVRVSEIAQLEIGQISPVFKSFTDSGYLYVKVSEKSDRQVSFEYIHVPLTVFTEQVASLKKDDKVNEYIKIDPQQYMKTDADSTPTN